MGEELDDIWEGLDSVSLDQTGGPATLYQEPETPDLLGKGDTNYRPAL